MTAHAKSSSTKYFHRRSSISTGSTAQPGPESTAPSGIQLVQDEDRERNQHKGLMLNMNFRMKNMLAVVCTLLRGPKSTARSLIHTIISLTAGPPSGSHPSPPLVACHHCLLSSLATIVTSINASTRHSGSRSSTGPAGQAARREKQSTPGAAARPVLRDKPHAGKASPSIVRHHPLIRPGGWVEGATKDLQWWRPSGGGRGMTSKP